MSLEMVSCDFRILQSQYVLTTRILEMKLLNFLYIVFVFAGSIVLFSWFFISYLELNIVGWNLNFLCCDIIGVFSLLLVLWCKHSQQIDKAIQRFI